MQIMMNGGVVSEAAAKKQQERETLRSVIQQWNANRLDLFELSEPNEDLEFHGVMRFYFQDSGQKVATKCIRVASDATTQAVIETLVEKFRPDMRMLSVPEYALYEIHENGEERRLGMDEKPLLVQLNWHIDDREGRFLLRRIDDKTNVPAVGFQEGGSSFRRKLSKREKKQLKKQEKLNKLKASAPAATKEVNDGGVAEKLYTELPETSFTRSISNPEAVMRRRRQQKLERKLQQFRSKDGGPDTGGTLKIYGESLCRDVPYKTLLLSVRDTAQQVVREMLEKYGLEKEADPSNYCLVQVNTATPADAGESKEYHGGTNNREYILDDDECPLAILMNHPASRGSIMFHVRRRPADYHPRKRKKKPLQKWNKGSELNEYRYEEGYDRLPFFLELNPDGSDVVSGAPKRHRLQPNVTEVGSERPAGPAGQQAQSLQLFGPNIRPRHCVVAHTEGIVTVTPCSRDAETYVNNQRIYETTILQHGAIVKFGRIHSFRFIDPSHDDRTRQRHDSARQALDYSYDRQSSRGDDAVSHGGASTPAHSGGGQNGSPPQNYETTFDVDGNVETVSTSSLGNKEETRSQRSVGSSNGNRLSNYERYPRGSDPILPAVLEFREETEDDFLHAVITSLDPSGPHFKLAPTYTLYLVARYRASTHYRPELTPTERAHRLTMLLARVAAMIHNVIQERYNDAKSLAFWMANSSELLHFLKSDRHISAFSLDAQDILAECVQSAFRNLVTCLQNDLASVMPSFMAESDESGLEEDGAGYQKVLQVLASAMELLRRCRVNAALTIQLFSQLFYYVNTWSFNAVVTGSGYCSREWGLRLKSRLAQLEVWAERQGLELAADCHLARIIQAAHLLQAPKYNAEDLSALVSTCFKLNSLQMRALLSKYQPAPDEPRLTPELIESCVRKAESNADELVRQDGREIQLEEEPELRFAFLLPEDGYSCDVVRGLPQGLTDFLAPLQQAGLCRLTPQPTSGGLWTIYMGSTPHHDHAGARSPSALSNRSGGYPAHAQPQHPLPEPEIKVIKLNKSNNGMGLSIVAAKGAGQDRLGIYIKSVVKGGAADADGQLQAGDQLLKVDGQSLVGITQEKAAEYLVRTGPTVTLEVAKQGAIYHGLATLLQQPSPVMGRGPRRMSERDLPSRIMNDQSQTIDPRRNVMPHAPIQSSKSVPSLNSGNGDISAGRTQAVGQHEVFNPGYSRTSSTNSIPQKSYDGPPHQHMPPQHQPAVNGPTALRSKSSQNLSDTRTLPPSVPVSRQASNPALHAHQVAQPQQQNAPQHGVGGESERFYQNLSIYRNQEVHNGGYPPSSPIRGSGPPGQGGKMPSPQGHYHDASHPAYTDRSPPHPQKTGLRGSQSSLHRTPEMPVNARDLRDRPTSAYIPQKDPYGSPQHAQGMTARSQSTRDMLRQEAKLHEMQEEVRRREMRGITSPQLHHPPHMTRPQMLPNMPRVPNTTYNYPASPQQQALEQGYHHSHHPMSPTSPTYRPGYAPPPTAPKPSRQPSELPQMMPAQYHHHHHQQAQQTEHGLYRESPPPPPPPTSTHPLYQGQQQHPLPLQQQQQQQQQDHRSVNDNRYAASMADPPRGSYYPTSSGNANQPPRQYQFSATNPWEREEREKEMQRRREAARMWRDQQIAELSALPQRTAQQEEQLRALKLEREFQRRAEEAAKQDEDEEGDEDQESIERVQGLLRMATLQSDASPKPPQPAMQSSQSSLPPRPPVQQQQQQQQQPPPADDSVARERARREQEAVAARRRQAELEQEERVREATHRREEELRQKHMQQQHQIQQQQQQLQQHQQVSPPLRQPAMAPKPGPLRLENLTSNGPASPPSGRYRHYNGYPPPPPANAGPGPASPVGAVTENSTGNSGGAAQRLDSLLASPPPPQPPERGSSFAVMSQQQSVLRATAGGQAHSQVSTPVSSPVATTTTTTVKRVSFHDPPPTSSPPAPPSQPPPLDQIREDPNHFINEAETLLASPKSPEGGSFPSNTPGVIGAQEVYKDPRARLLAAQQQQKMSTRIGQVPEKLSFKEKMKMFAMETGEDGTPRDKVKISRAQREIDNLAAGANTPTSNNNGTPSASQ